jgi:hypothetical protein
MNTQLGTANKPLHVFATLGRPPTLKDACKQAFMVAIPVAVVILMQNPALRSRIIMRGASYGKNLCRNGADLLTTWGDRLATMYNKARL